MLGGCGALTSRITSDPLIQTPSQSVLVRLRSVWVCSGAFAVSERRVTSTDINQGGHLVLQTACHVRMGFVRFVRFWV